jgi:hypothetical protein
MLDTGFQLTLAAVCIGLVTGTDRSQSVCRELSTGVWHKGKFDVSISRFHSF